MLTAVQPSRIDSDRTQFSETGNLIAEFLKVLNDTDMRYCVLRNYEDMGANPSEDIDILVRPTDILRIGGIFHTVAGKNGFYVISKKLYGRSMMLTAVAMDCDYSSGREIPLVEIHLAGYVSLYLSRVQRMVKGLACRVFLDDIATETYEFDDITITIPDSRWELLILLSRLEFKPKRKYQLRCLRLLARIGSFQNLQISSEELVGIINAAFEGQIDDEYRNAMQQLLESLKPEPGVSVIYQVVFLALLNIRYLFKRKGLIIFFSGPDGSGKTTIWKSVSALMEKKLGCKVIAVKYLYPVNNDPPTFLPFLYRRLRNVSSEDAQACERDRGSGLIWTLRRRLGLISIMLQYIFGYMAARLRTLAGFTVIVETSYVDAFVKGHRPRFKWLERFALPVLPPGDLCILLKADPKSIASRKPELTVAEIEDYYERISRLMGMLQSSPARIVTDQNMHKSVNDTVSTILRQLDKM